MRLWLSQRWKPGKGGGVQSEPCSHSGGLASGQMAGSAGDPSGKNHSSCSTEHTILRGLSACGDALRQSFPKRRLHLVLGIMADKKHPWHPESIAATRRDSYFTQPKYARRADPEALRQLATPMTSRQNTYGSPGPGVGNSSWPDRSPPRKM